MPGGLDDCDLAAALLAAGADAADSAVWDDPAVDWHSYDRVIVRSTWDYSLRREEFVAWADGVGAERLRNPPALLTWNSDKHYVADLAAAGLPVADTIYVGPGDPDPRLSGEVVVKPTVSAGGRDTGRFGPGTHDGALALIERLHASGRTAMVQPYLAAVDEAGERSVVTVSGAVSHVLHKRAVLAPDEEAPLADGAVVAARVMFDPTLVTTSVATDDELELALRVVTFIAERFGEPPLVARVDMVPGPGGTPVVLELEAIEPALYFDQAPGAAERLALAVLGEARDAASSLVV